MRLVLAAMSLSTVLVWVLLLYEGKTEKIANAENIPKSIFYILGTGVSAGILFERMLIVWDLVAYPERTACLLAIFPIRFLAKHSVVSNDSLFCCLIFMGLIAYKFHREIVVWFCMGCSILIDYEQGLVFSAALILMYAFGEKSNRTRCLRALFVTIVFCLFHRRLPTFGVPFRPVFEGSASIATLTDFHTLYGCQFPCIIGTTLLYWKNREIFIVSMLFCAYILSLDVLRIYDQSIICEVFSILIGFDVLFSSPKFSHSLIVSIPLYASVAFRITQISV